MVPEETKAMLIGSSEYFDDSKALTQSKHDPKRDLAYKRFKNEKYVDQGYFIINT